MGLVIDKNSCIGCGICADACANGALHIEDGVVVCDALLCTLCGICTDSCPRQALHIERGGSVHSDPGQWHDVWVFAEREDGLAPSALELTGCARRLADARRCRVAALLPCGTDEEARRLIAAGADEVILSDALPAGRLEAPFTDWIVQLASRHRPEILLFSATAFGRSLAPRVAARLGTGLTADCSLLDIDPDTGCLRQTRPAFGGNLMATIVTPAHRPQMATVRPGVMAAPQPDAARTGTVTRTAFPVDAGLVTLLREARADTGCGIAGAQLIVSAGRGIGQRKNLRAVYELARRLGGVVGVSRPLVEMGWAPQEQQIGQTGTAVSPKLLLCLGISGAVQHLAGISGAGTVIAVNTDPDAPIFSAADYKVVADASQVVRALLDALDDGAC